MTATAFEFLLDSLDPANRDRAGARYVELRENLTKFFVWRGCAEPEENADEALNRAAQRLSQGESVQNLRSYVFGIARLLYLETTRADARTHRARRELPAPENPREVDRREIRHQCLEICLARFDHAERAFLLDYYRGERAGKIENRKQMQANSNLSASGLRMRALRLREKLETCVRGCCAEREK